MSDDAAYQTVSYRKDAIRKQPTPTWYPQDHGYISSKTTKCTFFFSKGGCRNGDFCRFSHVDDTKSEPKDNMMVFVQNIPPILDEHWLQCLASDFGPTNKYAYVSPNSKVSSNRLFGFVYMACQDAATKLCTYLEKEFLLDDGTKLQAWIDESKSTRVFCQSTEPEPIISYNSDPPPILEDSASFPLLAKRGERSSSQPGAANATSYLNMVKGNKTPMITNYSKEFPPIQTAVQTASHENAVKEKNKLDDEMDADYGEKSGEMNSDDKPTETSLDWDKLRATLFDMDAAVSKIMANEVKMQTTTEKKNMLAATEMMSVQPITTQGASSSIVPEFDEGSTSVQYLNQWIAGIQGDDDDDEQELKTLYQEECGKADVSQSPTSVLAPVKQ